jgi:hypothetical protein
MEYEENLADLNGLVGRKNPGTVNERREIYYYCNY